MEQTVEESHVINRVLKLKHEVITLNNFADGFISVLWKPKLIHNESKQPLNWIKLFVVCFMAIAWDVV